MKIEILGTGCKKCKQLQLEAEKAVSMSGITADVIKIDNPIDIAAYGVMNTPAIAIDGKIMASGKVIDAKKIMEWLS